MASYENKYRILRELGRGAMGVVFLAEHIELERKVALKVLAPEHLESDKLMRRFRQEARAAKDLPKHDFVVQLLDYDLDGSPPWIAFEYIDGARPLHDVLVAGQLTIQKAVSLAWKIATGLGHIHRRGLMHRDLKPANILVTPTGDVKIIDLGLAKAVKVLGSDSTQITMDGDIVGTFAYMAPEQMNGEDIDARADVYALGLILIELAAGRLVFSYKADHCIPVHRRLAGQLPPLQTLAPAVRGSYERLVNIVTSCLAHDRSARPPDGAAVSRYLLPLIDTEPAKEHPDQVHGSGRRQRVVSSRRAGEPTVKIAAPFTAAHSVVQEHPGAPPRRAGLPWRPALALAVVLLVTCSAGLALWLQPSTPVPAVPLVTAGVTSSSVRRVLVGAEEANRLRAALERGSSEINTAWLIKFASEHKRIITKVPGTVSLALKDHLAKIGILEPLERFLPVGVAYFGCDAVPARERWALRYALCDLEVIEAFCDVHKVPLPWGETSLARLFPGDDEPIDFVKLDLEVARSWIRASNKEANKWFPSSPWEETWSLAEPRPGERLLVWFAVARWMPGVLLDVRLDRRMRRIIRYSPRGSALPPIKVKALEYELFGKVSKNVVVNVTEALRYPRAYIGAWFPHDGIRGQTHMKVSIVDLPLRGMAADDPSIVDRVVSFIPHEAAER